MIGTSTSAVDDLEAAFVAVGGAHDDFFKFGDIKQAGAGASDEKAAALEQAECNGVHVIVFVAAELAFFGIAGKNQFWRIEHDGVPLRAILLHLAAPGEGVSMDPVDAGLIQVGILLGLGDGFFIEIDAGDVLAAAEDFGADGEATSVAAQVEHAATFGEMSELESVVALVAEEAGLVAVLEADLVADVVFTHAHTTWRGIVSLGHIGPAHVFNAGDVGIDFDEMLGGAERGMQLRQPAAQATPHPEGGDLDGQDIRVTIDNEAAETVAILMHGTPGFAGFIEAESFQP